MYFLLFLIQMTRAMEPVCAESFVQLQKTENLKRLSAFVPESGVKGFVNKTRGSYFFLRSTENKITFTFFTTGIFDLYGIRRDGDIRFCDNEGQLSIIGLGQPQKISIQGSELLLRGESPVHTFEAGEVPYLIREKNNLSDF